MPASARTAAIVATLLATSVLGVGAVVWRDAFRELSGPAVAGMPANAETKAKAANVPETGPPRDEPTDSAAAPVAPAVEEATASTPVALAIPFPVVEGDITTLRAGLAALASDDVDGARSARDALPEDHLDRRILTWAIATSGKSTLTLGELNDAARLLSGWPGAETMRRDAERAFVREIRDPKAVADQLGTRQPETLAGSMALARAHVALGEPEQARQVLAPLWRTEKLSERDESLVIKEFGDVLSREDHRARAFAMLYADRARSAERIASRTGADSLIRAWAAVIRGDRNAASLLAKVDDTAKAFPGYRYARVRHLRTRDDARGAAALLMGYDEGDDRDAGADAWWTERRIVSRDLREAGDAKTAHAIVSGQKAGSPAVLAEAHFHAGWYALRDLDDPKAAELAFRQIETVTDGPISAARGAYWMARALEAQGLEQARDHYERAARHPTTYYGQLATRALGRTQLSLAAPVADEAARQRFERRELVQALRRLEAAGEAARAAPIKLFLAEQLTDPQELGLLSSAAISQDNHYLALRIGKRARWTGAETGFLTHPVGAIPDSVGLSPAETALAYAIARQESEFNIGAVSSAGARGLLQILPGTARDVAADAGLAYSGDQLTTDPAYNAKLGTTYLAQQIARNRGSYVLTFIAYNAGPKRVREWIARFGDPRGKPLPDVIDWVEQIPFTETRNYVMRVMENLQVYKARLGEPLTIVEDLQAGTPG